MFPLCEGDVREVCMYVCVSVRACVCACRYVCRPMCVYVYMDECVYGDEESHFHVVSLETFCERLRALGPIEAGLRIRQ